MAWRPEERVKLRMEGFSEEVTFGLSFERTYQMQNEATLLRMGGGPGCGELRVFLNL